MTAHDQANLIRRRKSVIEAQIPELQKQILTLQAELRDLLVAERVLASLSGESAGEVSARVEQPTSRAASTKPVDAPSVPEMIISVLGEGRKAGLRGMEPKEMTVRIAKLWWPDIRPEATNTIAWRMWKRGQLEKDGPVYMLPKKDEAADASLGGGTSTASATDDIFG